MILGIDISTSRTGVCHLSEDASVILLDDIISTKAKSRPTIYDRCDHLVDTLLERVDCDRIEEVWVESPLTRLGRGKSSANTITKLTTFNGMVSYRLYHALGLEPRYANCTEVRHRFGAKAPHKKKRPKVNGKPRGAKLYVADAVARLEPGIEIVYTAKGNLSAGYDDRLDAYLIARWGLEQYTGKA